jgi:hypothetical protein
MSEKRSLPPGVYFQPGRKKPYQVILQFDKRRYHFGTYPDPDNAGNTYRLVRDTIKRTIELL